MLLDDTGLKINAFDPVMAAVLGSASGEAGSHVLEETILQKHSRVELRDWLYCLAKAAGTQFRRFLIERPGKEAQSFVELIEGSMDEDDGGGPPPIELTAATVVPEVLKMLEAAEQIAAASPKQRVDDAILSLALWRSADPDLQHLLRVWATEAALNRFVTELEQRAAPPREAVPLFTEQGALNPAGFSSDGWRFCSRLREDMASIGAAKVTSRHLLYAMVSKEGSPLSVALSMAGVDVKRDVQALLGRELMRPGRKRNDEFRLTKDTLLGSVEDVLSHALKLTPVPGTPASERDIHTAFLDRQPGELTRLFPKDKSPDLAALKQALQDLGDDADPGPPLERYSIKEIEDKIKNTIFGQDAAVDRVIPWIKRLRFGLPRDNRPAGVFLFLGPTGAGKTQMAKELARYVYGSEDMLVFIEMGQFKTKESMSQFIGAPPGYVGYGDGKLTNGLRDKPESVVLFDEIEKADTQVFDTLLRFADEGMISDPAGPVRDGRKCIVVMTTNAGQEWLRAVLKKTPELRDDPPALTEQLFNAAMEEMQKKGFRPEFLGRLDERITFLPFSKATCRKIVDGVLAKEAAKLKKLKQVELEVNDEVRDLLARSAFDRSMDEGARGAPRAVNERIVTRAIDLLSDIEERRQPLPSRIVAVLSGVNDIVLEAES